VDLCPEWAELVGLSIVVQLPDVEPYHSRFTGRNDFGRWEDHDSK
jgi:hypothetical protein